METTINNNDLEQMRSQLDILKQKLDSQKIVNDRLIRSAMKQKMSWIRRYVWLQLVVLFPLVSLYWLALVYEFHLSWALYVYTVVMMGASSVFDYLINKMKDTDWERENLVETGRKLSRMYHLRIIELWCSIPVFSIFFAWLLIEICGMSDDRFEVAAIVLGAILGAIAGGYIAYKLFSNMQRTNKEIIEQIKEVTNQEG